MAIRSDLYFDRAIVGLTLFPEGAGSAITDDIEVPGFSPDSMLVWYYWDEEKLLHGEREFLGIEITDIADLTESDFAALERAPFPRVDSPEAGLTDATVAEVLRWAQRQYLTASAPAMPATVS